MPVGAGFLYSNTTIAFFVMPGCKEQFICVPVLMYPKVHCAPVLENHHFRAHMPLLKQAPILPDAPAGWTLAAFAPEKIAIKTFG
ncbi:hypothetical protein HED50_03920 [Ochrobactrum oryzae]|nr:hypothetical protein [Brucella oryzae]